MVTAHAIQLGDQARAKMATSKRPTRQRQNKTYARFKLRELLLPYCHADSEGTVLAVRAMKAASAALMGSDSMMSPSNIFSGFGTR